MPEAAPAPLPTPPLDAATVLLLRDAAPQLQVFMVVRHQEIDFASGALVFPGGKVDAADADAALIPYLDGAETPDARERAFRVAAIREAFEECGVLLARERATSPRESGARATLPPGRLKTLEPYRQKLVEGEVTMLDLVTRENLTLAADLMTPYSHWVTPAFVPKRFDTWFFLARAPEDQLAVHDGKESVDSVWVSPGDALADLEAKRRVIIFPTRLNLMMLDESSSAEAAILAAQTRPIKTVEPWIEEREGKKWLSIPADAGYEITQIPFAARRPAAGGGGKR